ncbi:MAG: hypothetical protein ACKVUS_04805 [Saprospiraceae bacterium]
MKKTLFTLLIALYTVAALLGQTTPPQSPPQTAPGASSTTITNGQPSPAAPSNPEKPKNDPEKKQADAPPSPNQGCCHCDSKLSVPEWLLTFAPLLIFLLVFGWMRRHLGELNKYLVESVEDKTVVAPNPYDTNAAAATTTTTSEMKPSTSRLVVFMAGFSAIIIAVCLTCFWVYVYLTQCTELSFDKITPVIWTLVVGITPYGFNRLSNLMK